RSYWGGDHSLFIGQVEYARYGQGAPLLFHGGRYELLLASLPVFSSLPPEVLGPILSSGQERRLAAADTIIREGDPGDELFVILEGEVRIERGGRPLHTFSTGEFFGELAVLDGRTRSASAVAVTDVRCLTV